ncbi:MAG: hypothetical protein FGM58_04350 [Acidimicrobiia bacterium]|nr:hypothetical protein [Acidimicrobiia bacterium]
MGAPAGDSPTVSVLIVCTANICRSPMAEALLQRSLDAADVPASVTSAGTSTMLEWGRPPAPEAVEVMATMGLDIAAHTSRPLTVRQIAAADLVIGMAREHLRDAALMAPYALPRLVTMKELVRRTGAAGAPAVGEDLGAWLGRLTADRPLDELLGDSLADDIADPFGSSVAEFRRTADELSGLADRVAGSLSLIGRPPPQS